MAAWHSQKGSALIPLFVGLLLVGLVALELGFRSKKGQENAQEIVYREQASFTNIAGMEYAMRRFYEGRSPVSGDVRFGPGVFRVVQDGREFSVMSWAGDAQLTRKVDPPPQADCLAVTSSKFRTYEKGRDLAGLEFTKKCGERVTLDRMVLTWNPDRGEGYKEILFGPGGGQSLYKGPPNIHSGRTAELIDFTLTDQNPYELQRLRFEEGVDLRDKKFQLVLLLGDGSRKTFHFTIPPCRHPDC